MHNPEDLAATGYFDRGHPRVQAFVEETLAGVENGDVPRIRALYLAVRDEIPYNPYVFNTDGGSMRASDVLLHGISYCIPKAVLFGAVARAVGIPSRLALANVKNHLSTPKMIEWLRTDTFAMHGYTELYIEGAWRKATPAFDAGLCERLGVPPLEFDGLEDSMFQQFSADGSQFMEYLAMHGTFSDVPIKLILDGLREHYPHLASDGVTKRFMDWDASYRAT